MPVSIHSSRRSIVADTELADCHTILACMHDGQSLRCVVVFGYEKLCIGPIVAYRMHVSLAFSGLKRSVQGIRLR